jgi:ribosomal protein L34E
MSEKTPWKKLQNKDYLGEYDFLPGEEKTVTIASIGSGDVVGVGGETSTKPVMRFVEPVKPLIVNTTNFKMMQRLFQSRFVEDWLGHQIILYGDPSVKFGRETVGGVRVKSTLPKQASTVCAECGEVIQGTDKYKAETIAAAAQKRFGRALCMECVNAEKARAQEVTDEVKGNE